MSLRITNIALQDFRSYEHLRLDDLGELTVFVGPNAAGKTNIIEGIQLMTALTSFRHAPIAQMVRKEASSARIAACFEDEKRRLDVSLFMEDHVKTYHLNGKKKRPSDIRGMAPAVTFTPDDLNLVKGGMSLRRQALDALGSQANASYHRIVRDYDKLVRSKNKLLKEGASPALLDSINEMLLTCGTALVFHRCALFRRLSRLVARQYSLIVGGREELAARMVLSWERFEEGGAGLPAAIPAYEASPDDPPPAKEQIRACFSRALDERLSEEKARGRSLVGPHADEVRFFIDDMDATWYGSQGQQRSIVLAFKMAESAFYEEVASVRPILLLDDVMSELDAVRRRALVDHIFDNAQTFVTTANLDYFDKDMLSQARLVQLPLEKHS